MTTTHPEVATNVEERILAMLREYVEENLKKDPSAVTLDATLTDAGVDSLSAIDFLFKVEEEFDIRLEGGELDGLTVRGAIGLVKRKLGERPTSAVAAA